MLPVLPMLAASAALVEPDPSPAVDLPDSLPTISQPGSPPAADPPDLPDSPPVIIEPPTESIIIAGQDAPSPLRRQVRAELGVLGLELVDVPGSDLSGVECGLVIDLPKRKARIVVQSARSDEVFTRTIALPRLDNDSNVRVAALQIVDILQTMRAEAHRPSPNASTKPEPESEPAPPEPEPPPPPSSRALALWASGGVQWNSGGLTPGAHADAGFAWSVRPWLAPALVSSWPVTARQRESPEGRVRVWPLSLAAGPRFGVGAPSAVVRFEILPALGVVLNLLHGEAQAPYTGQRRRSLGLAAQLRPGMSIRLGASLRLRVDALVGGQWPRVAIGVVGREEAAMDPLVLGGSVGLQLHPPLRTRGRTP